jgi:hypothetical protein
MEKPEAGFLKDENYRLGSKDNKRRGLLIEMGLS